MPSDIPALIRRKAELDVELVVRFRESVQRSFAAERKDLTRQASQLAPTDEYTDVLVDENQLLDRIQRISDQASIVSLYTVVELDTIRILSWRWPDAQKRNYYKVPELKRLLWKDRATRLSSLAGYKVVDELRCANNAVKHEGKVTAALADFPGWTGGAELTGLDGLFAKAATAIPQYLFELATVVVPAKTPR